MSADGPPVIRFRKGTPNWDFLTRPNGTSWPSRCEVCGKDLVAHTWVDLDARGLVAACSEQPPAEGGTDDHPSE